MKKTYYVTTPIYYPNDVPHVGHAYTTIAADVLARYHKLRGKQVFFLTGTDEHGKKIEEAAHKAGKKPQAFVDTLVPQFKDAWKQLHIEYDRFIRTTDKDHEKIVQEVLQHVYDNGDIYLGEYEGLYCVGCERYYTEKDLDDAIMCPIHKKPVERLKEASYFFRLSKYQDVLIDLYTKNPEFILPVAKRNEVLSKVKEDLKDFSISRTSFDWGIPLPFDNKHVCYVWFDALLNYYSGVKDTQYYPADVHMIGKDILWFHTVYWPAMLKAAGLPLPKTIFAHGFWTIRGDKISKSRGRLITVDELISIAGVDAARYFLLRHTAFGEDGDFEEQAVIDRQNNELLNKLGNLVSRTAGLIEKHGITKTKTKAKLVIDTKKVCEHLEFYAFDKALNEIFAFIDTCNEYVQNKKPWETKDTNALYELAHAIKQVAILLSPFIPQTSKSIAEQFDFTISWSELNTPFNENAHIKKGDHLFTRVEKQALEESKKETKEIVKNKQAVTEVMQGVGSVKYEDFTKLDLCIGEITACDEIPGADKLYKLTIDLGEKTTRTICAGIKQYYTKKELLNKQIVVIANLEPRTMKGVTSHGMLLAAGSPSSDTCILLTPDKKTKPGTKIS